MNCQLYLEESGRWIPNSGEKLDDFNIKLWYYADQGPITYQVPLSSVDLGDGTDLNNLKIICPYDPNQEYSAYDSAIEGSNIYKNRGQGFRLFAGDKESRYKYLLAEFRLKTDWAGGSNEAYDVIYNSTYFYVDDPLRGHCLEGVSLKTTTDKMDLYFSPDGEYNFYYFAIEPLSYFGLDLRPGDDLMLRFACAQKEEIVTSVMFSSDTIAVYDKYLLDRANTYIDERIDNDTGVPKLFRNAGEGDWEYFYRLCELDRNGTSQPEVYPWTHLSSGDSGVYANMPMYGTLPYSWGGSDSVYDFNADMYEQWVAVYHWKLYYNPGWNWWPRFLHPVWRHWDFDLEDYVPDEYENTLAPNSTWSEYRMGTTTDNWYYQPLYDMGYAYHPYRPGFSQWTKLAGPIGYKSEHVFYSAGLDCNGLVHRAMCYNGNTYKIPGLYPYNISDSSPRETWKTSGILTNKKADLGVIHDNSWSITKRPGEPDATNVMVPGDFLYMDGHIAIIDKITYTGNYRSIDPQNVNLIEAAYASGRYRVVNFQTWSSYASETFTNKEIMRPKTY